MNAGLIAFSEKGEALGRKIEGFLLESGGNVSLVRCQCGELSSWTEAHFSSDDALIFIGACGIAVRAIAPHIASKTSDPAVIVLDELGTYSIPLLSGHIGGANRLAVAIARHLGAIPVVTTATDISGVFAVDSWAASEGLTIANPERIKWVSARLLAGDTLRFKSTFPVEDALPPGFINSENACDVLVTYRTRGRAEALRLIPPVVTLGIGSKRGVTAEQIETAFALMLNKANCHEAAVKRVCSIDLKANEPGILEFCRRRKLPYKTFSAEALAAVPGNFNGSAFVKSVTGVDNVCERSAVLGTGESGRLLTGKDAGHGITMALAIEPYTVHFTREEKQ